MTSVFRCLARVQTHGFRDQPPEPARSPQETSSPLIPLQDHHTLLMEENEDAGFFLLYLFQGVSGRENAYSEGLDY